MTSRTRTYIDLTDLLRLHFTCKQCQASVDVMIDAVQKLPETCPNCERHWMVAQRGDMPGTDPGLRHAVNRLLNELAAVKRAMSSDRPTPPEFTLALEISNASAVGRP
jgi:hypothetical protein